LRTLTPYVTPFSPPVLAFFFNRYADIIAKQQGEPNGGGDTRSVASGGSGSKGSGSKGSRGRKRGSGSGGEAIEDLAKGKDVMFTTKVMKYLLKQHPLWHEMGLAYDCGSSLYTSERLQFPDCELHMGEFTDGPQYEEDITWPASKEINLKVVFTPVSLIVPPVEGEKQ